MAWYEITHACGHTQSTRLMAGNRRDRDSRAEWMAKQLCTDCYRAKCAEKRAEEFRRAAEETSALPSLRGTDKQILWATTIRREILARLRAMRNDVNASAADYRLGWFGAHHPPSSGAVRYFDELIGVLAEVTACSFWIDGRERNLVVLLHRTAQANPPRGEIRAAMSRQELGIREENERGED